MNTDAKKRDALQNRTIGLLMIAAIVVVCCVWPPNQAPHSQRGALDLLKDFGMGGAEWKIRTAVTGTLYIGFGLIGLYQVVTGKRVRRPEF